MSESQLICKECGQHLKRISNTHLMRCSGLTMQEYAYKHHISLEELVLSSVLEQTRQTVTNKTPDEILQIKTNTLHTLQEKDPIKNLTKEEEQIIIPKIGNQKITAWKTLRLSRNSSILQLLQRIRDESHRFAHKYSRELHAKIVTQ